MRPSGLMLLDLMVYISLVGLVLILTAVVFNTGLSQSTALRRNINDIERAMNAGERWRADVRAATGPVRTETREGRSAFVIPQAGGVVAYEVWTNQVRRVVGERRELVLNSIRSARMLEEKREFASAWRWEIELSQRRKTPRVRPLFTFIAVPGGG